MIIKPNFFIVGAPKAGTTSLYFYLKEHPDVYMSPIKEPNFFSYEDIIKQNLFYKEKGIGIWEEYISLFKDAKGKKAIGEASVSYLFYPNVPLRIKSSIPNAKIVIVLRNPIDRAYSHYLMDYRLGYVNIDFKKIVLKKTDHKWKDLYYQQYVELGFYYKQVKRYLDTFGKEQVIVFLNEDLKSNLRNTIRLLYDFLEIDTDFIPKLEKKYNVFEMPKNKVIHIFYSNKLLRDIVKNLVPSHYLDTLKSSFFKKGSKPKLESEIREYLMNLYKNDIKKLENLINRNLSIWYE